jgi:lipoprotein signal peptidase
MTHLASRLLSDGTRETSYGENKPRSRHSKTSSRFRLGSPLFALVLVAVVGLVVDQASKAWAFVTARSSVGPRELAPGLVTGILALNDGVMANLGGGCPLTAKAAGWLGLCEFVVFAFWARWRRADCPFYETASGGILAAGILGNAADRLVLGHVRDFLVITSRPAWIFNVADVFIVLGAIMVLGQSLGPRISRSIGAR